MGNHLQDSSLQSSGKRRSLIVLLWEKFAEGELSPTAFESWGLPASSLIIHLLRLPFLLTWHGSVQKPMGHPESPHDPLLPLSSASYGLCRDCAPLRDRCPAAVGNVLWEHPCSVPGILRRYSSKCWGLVCCTRFAVCLSVVMCCLFKLY